MFEPSGVPSTITNAIDNGSTVQSYVDDFEGGEQSASGSSTCFEPSSLQYNAPLPQTPVCQLGSLITFEGDVGAKSDAAAACIGPMDWWITVLSKSSFPLDSREYVIIPDSPPPTEPYARLPPPHKPTAAESGLS